MKPKNPPRDWCNTRFEIGDLVVVDRSVRKGNRAGDFNMARVVGYGNPDINPGGVRVRFPRMTKKTSCQTFRYSKLKKI